VIKKDRHRIEEIGYGTEDRDDRYKIEGRR